MTCSACGRANLPGGVRCAYCGHHFPPLPDFEIDGSGSADAAPGVDSGLGAAPGRSGQPARTGGLAALLILLFKGKGLLALLKLGPLLTTFSSMGVFVATLSAYMGWQLALGFTISIFLHEMGHVVMNWKHGLKFSAPMFIPFFGALIAVKQFPENPVVEAECGAGGPVAGMLAALGCLLLGSITGSKYWYAIAGLGFLINLANLLPVWQLDGAHITAAFSPGNWDFVLVVLLLIAVKAGLPVLWFLLIFLFVIRLGRGGYQRYLLATPAARARMVVVFLVLCLGLTYGAQSTGASMPSSRRSSHRTASLPQYQPNPQSESASRPALTYRESDLSPQQRTRREAIRTIFRAVMLAVMVGAAFVGWLIAAFLLGSAAAQRVGVRGPLLAVEMALAMLLLVGVSQWPPLHEGRWAAYWAFYAAMLAAVVYAAYQSAHLQRSYARPPLEVLTWRALAWGAGAALVVAYGTNNLFTVAVLAVWAAVYYARRRWLALSLAANVADRVGRVAEAIRLREKALQMQPPAFAAEELRLSLAQAYLTLGRGDSALEALDGSGRLPEMLVRVPELHTTAARAMSLAETDRFEEAMQECERMLRGPQQDRLGPLRLVLVRTVLAQAALLRSWPDEAMAQATLVQGAIRAAVSPTGRAIGGLARRARAVALLETGQIEQARQEANRALQWDRSLASEAGAAVIRARACLLAGDLLGAEQETAAALERLPGSLEALYWRAEALRAAGRCTESEQIFQNLARNHPRDHWGLLAGRRPAPSAV